VSLRKKNRIKKYFLPKKNDEKEPACEPEGRSYILGGGVCDEGKKRGRRTYLQGENRTWGGNCLGKIVMNPEGGTSPPVLGREKKLLVREALTVKTK